MNFKLEKWSLKYSKNIAKYANNPKIANNLRNTFPSPYAENDAINYINHALDENNHFSKAIVVNNEAIGSIAINIQDDVYIKSAELGYWIGEDFWNKGIISKAITEFSKEVFNNFDIIRIFAEPFSYNLYSTKALENANYKLEGIKRKSIFKNGNYYDSYLYSLIKED